MQRNIVRKKRAKKKNSVLSFNLSNSRNGKDGKLQKFRRSHCFSNFTLYFTYFSLHLLYTEIRTSFIRIFCKGCKYNYCIGTYLCAIYMNGNQKTDNGTVTQFSAMIIVVFLIEILRIFLRLWLSLK